LGRVTWTGAPEERLFSGERIWFSFGREYYDRYGIV